VRLRALLALVMACSVAACFSFGDLSGGDDTTSSSSDAGGDSTTDVDGKVIGDGAPKDGASSDSGSTSGPFCVGEVDATFCTDFDEEPDAMTGFSSLYLNDGGIFGFDDEFVSGPRGFFSGNSALPSGTSAHAALVKHTGVIPSAGITLDFDMRIDSLSTQNTQVESLAIVNLSPTRSSLQLNVKSTATDVGEEVVELDGGVIYNPHYFPQSLPVGTYVHVHIAVDIGVSTRTLTVVVGPDTMIDHVGMNPSFVFGAIDLYLGNAYSPGASDGAKIHFDNVSLKVE